MGNDGLLNVAMPNVDGVAHCSAGPRPTEAMNYNRHE